MIAAGAYLQTLRESQDLSLREVGKQVGTSASQLLRIENGEQETRASLFFRLVEILKGNQEHARYLLLNESLSKLDGQSLAEVWLENPARAEAFLRAIQDMKAELNR